MLTQDDRPDGANAEDREEPGEAAADAIRWQPGQRLHHLFEDVVDRLAADGAEKRPAVSTAEGDTSYAEIDARANRLARWLLRQGLAAETTVAILLSRSADAYVAMLAVSKAGLSYVPLDAGFPADRIAFILDDTDAAIVLTVEDSRHLVPPSNAEIVTLESIRNDVARQSAERIPGRDNGPADAVAYLIYTSGSTGKPKGVVIAHSSICNFLRVADEIYGVRQSDRVYQGMTIAFDFSIEEIFVAFMAGATLVPGPSGGAMLGEELEEFLINAEISALCCVPTLLSTLRPDLLPQLRFILVSGESCPANLIARWHQPWRRLLNVYGPTEATVSATWKLLDPAMTVTIGKALPTYSVAILDMEARRVADVGEVGEICIAGIGLAVGYKNRRDLTAKAFIADFIGFPDNPSNRIYRTGDLGRLDENGEIEFLGRADTQVKIRGYRIELSEIESVLMAFPSVGQAVVSTYEPEPGLVELVAYCTPQSAGEVIDVAGLVSFARQALPQYMVPSYFEPGQDLPKLPSDKIDRKSLPPPSGPRFSGGGRKYEAPESKLERTIADCLAETLKMPEVSASDHFFDDLGANSLSMAKVCTRLRELGLGNVGMRDIYLHPTVRSLALACSAKSAVEEGTAGPADADPAEVRSGTARQRSYVLTAVAQTATYVAYFAVASFLALEGYSWISATVQELELNGLAQSYLTAVWFTASLFVVGASIPVAAKWALIGRWKATAIPLWGRGYYRFWVVKTLLAANPILLFAGSPIYNIYLRLLGAKIGKRVLLLTRNLPVAADLLVVGDEAVIREGAVLPGYAARHGRLETGPISIGKRAFIGEAAVLGVRTVVGDGAQLGNSSCLPDDRRIPDGTAFHGSPAENTDTNYDFTPPRVCGRARRAAYSVGQVATLVLVTLPIPFVLAELLLSTAFLEPVSEGAVTTDLAFGQTATYLELIAISAAFIIGGLLLRLVSVVLLPRLLRPLIRTGTVYPLFGFAYSVARTIRSTSNSKLLNTVFGDSSYILHYLRLIGFRMGRGGQTGSNFGLQQRHDSPFECEVGEGTMVSDGLTMTNMEYSFSSFQLQPTRIGGSNFLGNNIVVPSRSMVGDNCLLATKVLVPIDGEMRSGVGLLGSPSFEIPRGVFRDRNLTLDSSDPSFQARLRSKLLSNTITMFLYLSRQVGLVFIALLLGALTIRLHREMGDWSYPMMALLFPLVLSSYFILVERAALLFRRLRPRTCSIYNGYYWRHERYWKLGDSNYLALFNGTPIKGIVWRALGVRVGRRLFDDGCAITERSLVELGDDCILNQLSTLQSHSLEEGVFKSDWVRLGDRATIGVNGYVHYGTVLGRDSALAADSFLMKGERLADGSLWEGNPATPRTVSPTRLTQEAEGRPRISASRAPPNRRQPRSLPPDILEA